MSRKSSNEVVVSLFASLQHYGLASRYLYVALLLVGRGIAHVDMVKYRSDIDVMSSWPLLSTFSTVGESILRRLQYYYLKTLVINAKMCRKSKLYVTLFHITTRR